MQHPAEQTNNLLADTIRRTMRVLGAQPSPASDPQAVASAARLVYERLRRSDVPTLWINENPGAPLVVAGRGPIAIATYLDDTHPDSVMGGSAPPTFDRGMVRGAGVERKAGVVAALSTLLSSPQLSNDLTVIVETDRHAGSLSLERWLAHERSDVRAVAWEVADIPLNPPVISPAATGRLIVHIELRSPREGAEYIYGGVLPDIGFALASVLASLKTTDEEVRLPGFYDNIASPDEQEFASLVAAASDVSAWLEHVAASESNLSTAHMALGVFCAPSVVVRDINVVHNPHHLPSSASATVEFQLMPGQTVEHTLDELRSHIHGSSFETTVTTLLARSPYPSDGSEELVPGAVSIPVAPGPSPAALFAGAGLPGVGYAVVGRRAGGESSAVPLDSIADGVRFLLSLAQSLSASRAALPR